MYFQSLCLHDEKEINLDSSENTDPQKKLPTANSGVIMGYELQPSRGVCKKSFSCPSKNSANASAPGV